jgi:hypothetical protein
MRMTAFRIQNFRSILDSGWVTIKDIIGIVGKNEAGKTSLLKALWKFNPFKSEPYNLDREWPRGRRKERSPEKPVSTVRFEFAESERKEIAAIDATCSGVTGVEITRLYSGKSLYTFLPKQINTQAWGRRLIAELKSSAPKTGSTTLKAALSSQLNEIERTCDNDDPPSAKKALEGLKAKLASMVSQDASEQQSDRDALAQFAEPLNQALSALAGQTPVQRAIEMTSGWLPKFIYMDV